MKRFKTLYRTLAITTVACLLCYAITLAGKPIKPDKPGGGDPTYFLTDLLGFPGGDFGSSGEFITNQTNDGFRDVLIYGFARHAGTPGPLLPALWHVDINGTFPEEDAEDRGVPAWAEGATGTGINNSGVMVGITGKNGEFGSYVDVPGSGYQKIPSPLSRNTEVYGINDAGVIVGHDDGDPALWHVTEEGLLSGPINLELNFHPWDINNWGVMTGEHLGFPAIAWFEDGVGDPIPAIAWFEDQTAGTLRVKQLDSSPQFLGSIGGHLNNCDIDDPLLTIVGTTSRDENGDWTGTAKGFAWRPFDSDNPTSLLGTLGGSHTWPSGVNVHGEIVGGSRTKNLGRHAFIYKDGKMTDLNSMAEVGRKTLNHAVGINDDRDIVGFMRIARHGTETHGFLLRVIP